MKSLSRLLLTSYGVIETNFRTKAMTKFYGFDWSSKQPKKDIFNHVTTTSISNSLEVSIHNFFSVYQTDLNRAAKRSIPNKKLSNMSHMLLPEEIDGEFTTTINTFNDPVALI
jgi:hypothetical protein